MQFLKYLWQTSLREASLKVIGFTIVLAVILVTSFITPLWVQELSRLVCYTGIMIAIPIVMIFMVRNWLHEKWRRYQQVNRLKDGDHSA